MVRGREVVFVGRGQVEVREMPLPSPSADQILVETEVSAISAGTEMLLYRGEVPTGVDAGSDLISGGLKFPTPYGYCAVGKVVDLGASVDRGWLGRVVFAFKPHASHFLATPDSVIEVPSGTSWEQALFLPNAETAVNLVQDAAPILGERAIVFGQGVVGLLTAGLLSEFPLEQLVTVDRYAIRRQASQTLGSTTVLNPADDGFQRRALQLTGPGQKGFDIALELTGNPTALNDAIALTMFSGRIVIGSWFGTKTSPLELGGAFHRSRITLMASQVSTIAPELRGRWDKERRFGIAWNAIRRIGPDRWITHRFVVENVQEAYRLLDKSPESTIQVLLSYK